jgi:hypothetical protein
MMGSRKSSLLGNRLKSYLKVSRGLIKKKLKGRRNKISVLNKKGKRCKLWL